MATAYENILRTILDLYSEKRRVPIAFVYNNEVIWQSSKKFCSPYCQELIKLFPEKCFNNHNNWSKIKEEKLIQCHAGIWNFVMPISIEGKLVGTLVLGQRRLRNEYQEFLEISINFQDSISKDQFSILERSFYATPLITYYDFNLLKTLDIMEERLLWIFLTMDIENGRFIDLGHAIFSPIGSIIADAENLYNELSIEKVELKEQAKGILDQTSKLGKTAKNMMGMRNDKYSYKLKNIRYVLNENINLLRNEAIRKNIKLLDPISMDGSFPEIPMSYELLSHAFYNLIDNAIKYSLYLENDDKSIQIIGKNESQNYIIEITNYGIGILEDEINSGEIFLPGRRGKLAKHNVKRGLGRGLSIAKEIIERHDGKIEIKSILLGKDKWNGVYKTTVYVCLPKFRIEVAETMDIISCWNLYLSWEN